MAWKRFTDKQGPAIRIHLPKPKSMPKGGRPRADDRRCLEGILWILWTSAYWEALPAEYGSRSTVHRRLSEWAENGVLLDLWRAFLMQLSDRQRIAWNE